jgi:aspartyl/asparaginyl beta-hydroxylase (cupin superfamily)
MRTRRRAANPGRMIRAHRIPHVEYFDRAAVPPEIAELLDEWPEIDPETARLIRAAVMSGDPQRLRRAWQLLAARAELARMMR